MNNMSKKVLLEKAAVNQKFVIQINLQHIILKYTELQLSENCNSKKVDNTIFIPLFGIIDSKEHVKINVSQIKVVMVRTPSQDGGKFGDK